MILLLLIEIVWQNHDKYHHGPWNSCMHMKWYDWNSDALVKYNMNYKYLENVFSSWRWSEWDFKLAFFGLYVNTASNPILQMYLIGKEKIQCAHTLHRLFVTWPTLDINKFIKYCFVMAQCTPSVGNEFCMFLFKCVEEHSLAMCTMVQVIKCISFV